MTTEAPSSYAQVSTRDEEESDVPSDSRERQDHPQDPAPALETPNAPSAGISPPISPPRRSSTEGSYKSASARPLTQMNTRPKPKPQQFSQSSEKTPRTRRFSSLGDWKERVQGSFTPSQHDLLVGRTPDPNTQRQYDRKQQRRRLLRLTIGEFFNTVAICLLYFGVLWSYSRMKRISIPERRVFNALSTAITLVLGVNLAASLRSYAKLLRWRMLAICYRPLETFDLVMGCDSLMNVLKLLWKAKNHRFKFLPSLTQIICLLWLIVHLAVTVLVGIIGLNYNLDDSTTSLFTTTGNVSIVDLNALSTGSYSYDLAQVQQWGVRGDGITPLDFSDPIEFQQSYFSDQAGYTMYYFQDQNAFDTANVIISTREISAQAYCTGHIVTEGQYGNLSYIIYDDGGKVMNQSMPTAVGPGGLIVISKLNSTCGSRCVDMFGFQAATLPSDNSDNTNEEGTVLNYSIAQGQFFVCNNTVPQVADDVNHDLSSDYMTSDLVGRMLAGMVGWSDLPPAFEGTAEYSVYTNSSRVSFGGQPIASDMAMLISDFTMGGIAFMDNSFTMSRINVTSDEQPIIPQILKVKWRFAGAILAVIPFIHLLTLLAVIAWANKAIIKDDSHLAIAKVYHTLLRQLEDSGCLLRGDEIVKVLANPNVAYGWGPGKETEGERLMHVDIFEHGLDHQREDSRFPETWYDGSGWPRHTGAPYTEESGLRRRYRDFDAAEYF